MKIVARSVKVEPIDGKIERCADGENSKFYCLKVLITFSNGTTKEYVMRAHNEPKTLERFINNDKGYKDKFQDKFALTDKGEVVYLQNVPQEALST
ncbi:MAG: hypothetical protein ACP5UF_05835 [Hydrogenobaculum sp.]